MLLIQSLIYDRMHLFIMCSIAIYRFSLKTFSNPAAPVPNYILPVQCTYSVQHFSVAHFSCHISNSIFHLIMLLNDFVSFIYLLYHSDHLFFCYLSNCICSYPLRCNADVTVHIVAPFSALARYYFHAFLCSFPWYTPCKAPLTLRTQWVFHCHTSWPWGFRACSDSSPLKKSQNWKNQSPHPPVCGVI